MRLTERILIVFTTPRTLSVVLRQSSPYTITHALIHLDSNMIVAPNEEIDKETSMSCIRYALEQVHHVSCKRKSAVFGCDCQSGDMTMPVMLRAFRLSNN